MTSLRAYHQLQLTSQKPIILVAAGAFDSNPKSVFHEDDVTLRRESVPADIVISPFCAAIARATSEIGRKAVMCAFT
jgi:hypothetical protein